MAMMQSQLQLEKRAYQEFLKLWRADKFRGQRLGQAFYNHFRLHRLANQEQLRNLFNLDGDAAHKVIGEVFRFN